MLPKKGRRKIGALQLTHRLDTYRVELLFERLILFERHRQRRAQRYPLRREERELLPDALDDALEGVARLVADLHLEISARRLVVPEEGADRRRVPPRVDLQQLIDLVCIFCDALRASRRAFVCRVEEEVEREPLVLPAHEL